jgi:hypothetical protein
MANTPARAAAPAPEEAAEKQAQMLVKLPEDAHARFKVVALIEKTDVSALVRGFVDTKLKQYQKRLDIVFADDDSPDKAA